MIMGKHSGLLALVLIAAISLAACSGGGGSGTVPAGDTFTIGGTVSGLTGAGLVLQNNAGDDESIAANGSFTFNTAIANNGSYSVTVKTQPSNQACTVASGSGTVSGANVTNVAVTCTNIITAGLRLGTLITSPTVTPVLSFHQSVISNDTGTSNPYNEIFPGQANVWFIDGDFTLVDGFDKQFFYALYMSVSSGTTSTFLTDQDYSELSFYTPYMTAADGVKTVVVSDVNTVFPALPSGVKSAQTGTSAAFLNATSDSRLQQTLDLTSASGTVPLSWHYAVSLGIGNVLMPYDAVFRVVARQLDGTQLGVLFETRNPTESYQAGYLPHGLDPYTGQTIVLSFELRSSDLAFSSYPAYAIIDSVTTAPNTSFTEYVTNGDFVNGLTGWSTNLPQEVQNVTSGVRKLQGLDVKRSFYTVPNKLWGRWVDVFENKTLNAIAATVTYETNLDHNQEAIIYYAPGTNNKALTSWDHSAKSRDIGFVYGNANTPKFISYSELGDGTPIIGDDGITYTYDITVQPNSRVAIVNFIIMDGTDTGQLHTLNAKATTIDTEAAKIVNDFWNDVQYRDGMTQEQISAISNF